MKKILSILLAMVIALSCAFVAFADETTTTTTTTTTTKVATTAKTYVCPTCKATYYTLDDYNTHLVSHNELTCPTCGKIHTSLESYNACIDSHRLEDPSIDKFEYAWDKYFSSKTVYEVADMLVGYFKELGVIELLQDYITRIIDFIEAYVYDSTGVAGATSNLGEAEKAVTELESKVASLGFGENTTIKSLITGLKQKIKDLYAGERATVEPVTEAEAPAETGSTSLGICAFAAVSIACAAAFVCTKKKD